MVQQMADWLFPLTLLPLFLTVDTEKTVTKKKRKKKSPDVVGFVPPGLAAREDTGSKQEAKPIIYWLRKASYDCVLRFSHLSSATAAPVTD